MVEEVRRQFREIPGILEGKAKPEYEKCVAISTDASIKKMMPPGAIAILSPLIIGFAFGPEVLGGFLAGATVSGVLLGMFQNNAGGAWDNAKKSFEKGVVVNGETYYKGSDLHKASVTGDTVGDPFKDTSGPSMNILIKLMSIVSLVIAPTLANMFGDKIIKERLEKIENLNSKMISGSDQKIEIIEEKPIVLGTVNADGDFVYELGDLEKVTLNSGQEINLGANSQLYNLYKKLKVKDAGLVYN